MSVFLVHKQNWGIEKIGSRQAWNCILIPWLQAEADSYHLRHNSTCCQRDTKKLLPTGIPDLIYNEPRKYANAQDYKVGLPTCLKTYANLNYQVIIPKEVIDQLEEQLPPDHPVFQLIPKEWEVVVEGCYSCIYPGIEAAGGWKVTNFWEGFVSLTTLIGQALPDPGRDYLMTVTRPSGWEEADIDPRLGAL